MARVLYLVHRLPYPPNKGDKVRSYHLLRHLAARHDVLLGTFVDDPDDAQHVPTVRQWCKELHAVPLNPMLARLASLSGLSRGEPLTLAYYRNAGLARWVRAQQASHAVDAVVVFSSSMAQYAVGVDAPNLIDFVDVDSAKWGEYAGAHRWPMSWLYRREAVKLLAYERDVAMRAQAAFFVTEKECALFRSLAPECGPRIEAVGNGVDADFFDPGTAWPSPYADDEIAITFTGAMDYWPNVDAVTWFATEVLPDLLKSWPTARFYIVGRSPTAAVQALASHSVVVTGTVSDVRPYLQHAAVVVAPLRLARGIQNKVLEAMAMARPVVVAANCAQAIDATAGVHFLTAESVQEYIEQIGAVLTDRVGAGSLGRAARIQAIGSYGWTAQLSAVDRHLAELPTKGIE